MAVQIVLAALTAATAGRFNALELSAKKRQVRLATAYAALADDSPNLEAIRPIFPAPRSLLRLYAYARSHNMAPAAHEFLPQPRRLLKTVPNWGGYHIVPASNCSGFLDAVQRIASDRVAAQGWAWDIAAKRAPRKIVMALPGGTLVGVGDIDTPRPDVQKMNKIVSDPFTGWNGEALAPTGSLLRAFAVLSDWTSICPLNNEIPAR